MQRIAIFILHFFKTVKRESKPTLLLHPFPCSLGPSNPDVFLLPPSPSLQPALSVSHGVLAKLVAELLDEQSQLASSLRLLLQELVAEAGNILFDLLQLTYNRGAHTDTH